MVVGGANACRWRVLAGDGVLGRDWNVVAFLGGLWWRSSDVVELQGRATAST